MKRNRSRQQCIRGRNQRVSFQGMPYLGPTSRRHKPKGTCRFRCRSLSMRALPHEYLPSVHVGASMLMHVARPCWCMHTEHSRPPASSSLLQQPLRRWG